MARDPITLVLACASLLILGGMATLLLARSTGVLGPACAALVLRLVYGAWHFSSSGIGGNDGTSYDEAAREIVAWWQGDASEPVQTQGKEAWPFVLAFMYRAVGHSPELAILLNVILGALTVVLVAAICNVLDWREGRRPAAWIMALWPVSVLWGPLLLREAAVTFLLALGLLGAVLMRQRRLLLGVVVVLLAGIPMIWFRGGLSFLILVGLPMLTAASFLFGRPNASNVLKALALGALGLMVILPFLSGSFEDAGYFDSSRGVRVSRDLDAGTTGFTAAGVDTDNRFIGILNTAVGPFPTAWRNFGMLAAGLDAVLWLAVWLMCWYGFRRVQVNRWGALMCAGPAIALIFFVSQNATNFGLIMRLRALGLPFVAPLAGVGLAYYLAARRGAGGTDSHELKAEQGLMVSVVRPSP